MWKRRLLSFKYAFRGLGYLFRTQANAAIHLVALVCVVVAGFYFEIALWEWCAVVLAAALVLAMEALNTALESLCDHVSPEFAPLIGRAKDVAAAAVLVAALGAAAVGILIFLPKVF